MNLFKNYKPKSLFITALTIATTSTYAAITVVVSAPPPPRAIVMGPPGYISCYTVRPGFYNGVWHHTHRVCEYDGNNGFRMWVTGYWQCGSYLPEGRCTGWHWIGSHWATRTEIVLYSRPSHRDYYRHVVYGHGYTHGYRHRDGYEHGHEGEYRHEHRHGNHWKE